MRNYELLTEVYEVARRSAAGAANDSTCDLTANLIVDLVKRERPDIVEGKNEFSAGGKQKYQ